MPEFKETDPKTDPTHNYTPSKSASTNKGGRRRSGGFKSEATPSNQKIGEVDPAEVLKADITKSSPKPENQANSEASCSIKKSKSSPSSCNLDRAPKSADGTPQPSQATLDSIKKVEERISRRRAEIEKNQSGKSYSDSNKRNQQRRGKSTKKKGGLLGTIAQFFGSLFGGSPKGSSHKNHRSSRQKQSSQKNSQRRNGKYSKDNSDKRYNNRSGGQRHRRKNAPQNT